MTSRGNQSVSPPAQIPQQRHVNAISSSTPPPHQYYPGPASALSQGAYDFLPQGQPFNPYQAYGSALSDTRGQPGNSGRGGPPQQNLPQGGNFFQQPGPNIRPQQTQQSHTYFLSTQPQGNIRPPRSTHQSASQMVFIPQNFTPRNNVILSPANVYQSARVPVFQSYVPGTPFQTFYYQNGAPAWQGPGMAPSPASAIRPQVREKKVLSIKDPDTGRDITEELLNNSRSHSTSAEDQPEEGSAVNQNDKEICQTFTRLVADRLKSPDDSNTSGTSSEPHGAVSVAPVSSSGSVSASQQFQQPPPQQQPTSIAPVTMMRPPPSVPHHIIPSHAGLIPQSPTSTTPSHDIQHQVLNVNFSMPPPQFPLRQPTPTIYSSVPQQQQQQQHPTHHIQRHPQPPQQQQSIRPQLTPVIPQTAHQTHIQPQPQHQPPQPAHNLPSNEATLQHQKVEANVPEKQKSQAEATSQNNIPDKPAGQPAPATARSTSPIKEVTTGPPPTVEVEAKPSVLPSSLKTVVTNEEVNAVEKIEDCAKVETPHGGSQVVKDGRKGKKGKKDFICKEIGGTDMDAFIDVGGANSGAGENNMTRTNNALDIAAEASSIGLSVTQSSSEHSLSNNLEAKSEAPVIKDQKNADLNVQKQAPAPPPSTVATLERGYSRDDSPNPQKNQEQQKPSTASAQKQSEPVDLDDKPPLPHSVRKSSLDKPAAVQDFKIPLSSIPATQKTSKIAKEPGPVPQSPTSVRAPTHQPEVKVEKTVIAPQKDSKTVVQVHPKTDIATSITTANRYEHQRIELTDGNLLSKRLLGQSESSKPFENGIPDNVTAELVSPVKNNVTGDSSGITRHGINYEEEHCHEPGQRGDDFNKSLSHDTSNEEESSNSSLEKTLVRVKRDGKEKLQYDRAYLMELRESASSQAKPEGLPNLEIILDRPVININRGSNAAPLDFTPAFFQPSSNQRQHAPQIGKTNSRNRPRTDLQMPPRVIKSVSLQDSVKPLHQSEKPWKPTQKQSASGELTEKRKSLEAEVLFIMNRLTPTNFERLAVEMRNLNINTYEDLQELVKIFFDKVTMETKFVEAYANLCKVMSPLKVQPLPNMKDTQATFRVVMLTKCQQEFEADKTVVFEDPEEKRKKIEAEVPESPERLAQIENTLYQMKLKRLKFYGNIRFIGELFKLGLLTETIMHDCIFRLLKARDDDSLVSLCNLIATVGQALDTDKAKTRMDQYFAKMSQIAEERKSRIKFTLKDTIDLRSNNWIPRKEQTGPKKIDEVHKDFQEEQATKQFLQNQPMPPRNDGPQPNKRGSRQRQDELKLTDDGWNTVGSKSLRIDASKMKLSKNIVDENSIQLGPGGGMKQFSMWSRGSYGGAQPTQDMERNAAPGNRFSALRGEEDRRNYQRSPSRGENNVPNRGMRHGPTSGHGRGKILARSSQEGERRDALASARSIVGGRSQNSSRDNSWNREDRRQIMGPRGSRENENPMTRSDITLRPNMDSLLPPTVSPTSLATPAAGYDDLMLKKVKPLSKVEMEHKAKTILEEYLSVLDLEEAKLCLMELRGQEHLHVLVTASVNEVLERSNKERDLTGSFFHEMVKGGQLHLDVYLKGLSEVLQYAEDMVIDIPMIWTYLAQVIVPMLLRGSLSWSSLPATLNNCLGDKCSAKLVAQILLLAKEKTSEVDVALMWQNNNLNWTAFLHADEVERFLKDKKLEFTVAQVARTAATSRVPGYSQLDLQKLSEDIEKIVRENGTSSDIFAYIDARFPAETRDKHFIRALVTGLINISIPAQSLKLNEEVIKTHKSVLQQCIKSNPELELQALYAIQALMHKLEHPSGVVATIFDLLYDEDIISEETFKQWEKSTDPLEVEGKGACFMQLTQFFTWLRENEEPETS